ncbi:MAG: hypothetical protein M3R51_06415 [Candidatus Eremiobacteraeota bacterium]|nr:hypothetical protein [Candidatus Eremiobacteraeota bacterium]
MHIARAVVLAAFVWLPIFAWNPAMAAPAADVFSGLTWRSIGPAISGGRAGAVAGSDANPALYYVGAAGGGVWKTTNAGTSWKPVFDSQDVASIGSIAIDPHDDRTVWVGTGESNPRNDVTQGDGVYKTTDGGDRWSRVLPLRNSLIGKIIVDPRNTNRVVVAVLGDPFADSHDRGIYRTLDGGASWKKTLDLGLSSGASDLVADPRNPNVLFAGMWQFRRTGWSLSSGGRNDGLYRSADGGESWTKETGHGLPAEETGRIAIAIAPSNPQRIYALIETKGGLLWRSDDAGANWTLVSSDRLIDERPFYYTKIFVDATNADRVWAESVHMALSADGGKTFGITGQGTHGDHHVMWIAQDGRRIAEGDDGGVSFSHDDGASWQWQRTLPISQLYRIGYSRGLSYGVCAGLQDNGNWCGPAVPLAPSVSSSQWLSVGSGDGTFTLFDPRDERLVWQADAGSNFAPDLSIHNFRTGETREISPYLRDQNVIDPKNLAYRFNWETPIAFDPFDSSRAYTAGNVVFTTRDRGDHWSPISPDLTLHIASHEVVSGNLTLDGTGAETSDTILSLVPSPKSRGLIWAGTDDGVVQLTRDGGKHWANVTPAGIKPDGRFSTISVSNRNAGVAYAVYDRHMVGDRTPYVFFTRNFGTSWTPIAQGLPQDDEARSILADPRTPGLIYLGLERSLWASWNDGAAWERINANLPSVSVRDLQLQPDTDDLVIATHGRGAYVLDDATPLQNLASARAAGTYLFAVRDGIEWNWFRYHGTRADGDGPAYGATISYYLAAPAKTVPTAEILDERGAVVRRFTTHDEDGKAVPDLANNAGIDRFSWDLTEENARLWTYAPQWNRGTFDSGPQAVPGRYTLRLHVGGRTLERFIVVKQDPRTHYTLSQLRTRHGRIQALIATFSRVDDALNALSAFANGKGSPALTAAATDLIASITSNPQNDQDNDFLPDVLRERLQGEIDTYFSSNAPATQAQIREDGALQALARERLAAFRAFAARAHLDVAAPAP